MVRMAIATDMVKMLLLTQLLLRKQNMMKHFQKEILLLLNWKKRVLMLKI